VNSISFQFLFLFLQFVTKPKAESAPQSAADPAQDLLASANELASATSADMDEEAIKKKIRAIMRKYAAPGAKGGKSYNTYEAV